MTKMKHFYRWGNRHPAIRKFFQIGAVPCFLILLGLIAYTQYCSVKIQNDETVVNLTTTVAATSMAFISATIGFVGFLWPAKNEIKDFMFGAFAFIAMIISATAIVLGGVLGSTLVMLIAGVFLILSPIGSSLRLVSKNDI